MDAASFDFANPAFRADPYPAYRFLREASPLWRAPTGQWVLSTHAGCSAVLKHPQMGRMNPRLEDPELDNEYAVQKLKRMMLFQDPPLHTRLRGLVNKAFNARRMEALRGRIEAIVDELIGRVEDRRRMCLIRDFAHRLPVTVIFDMLGVPEEDRAPFLNESTVQGRLLDPVPMSREEMDAANQSMEGTDGYFRKLLTYRRENPGEDLVTALVQAREADETLSDDEILANISLLFGAGHETTTNLIGNGLLALHRNPAELARLKAEPSLMPNAVEELLRYDSPVQMTSRIAIEKVDVLGQPIEPGEEVITLLGAANRDPEAYAGDPEALNVERPGVRAISFGGGLHYCLGAQLARIEGEIALRRLFERLPGLRVPDVDDVVWKNTVTLRGLNSLQAVW